jgi:type IV pilus assembly protein PilY1
MKIHAKLVAAFTLLLTAGLATAEDIDLFIAPPEVTPDPPNLLLVLDNAANFSSSAAGNSCIINGVATALSGTVGGIEQCALYNVIAGLETNADTATVNIGVMVYKANNVVDYKGNACQGGADAGGCLVYPIVPLTTANKKALLDWIRTWKTTGKGLGYIKANNEAIGASMQESWAYLKGRTGLSGRNYADIVPVSTCGKNFMVFVGNSYSSSGTPGDSTGNAGPRNALEGINSTAGMNANPAATAEQKELLTNTIKTSCDASAYTFPTSSHENKGFYADEWARYMASQNIVTYTVGVLGSSCQEEYAALLTNMAYMGQGKYFPTNNYEELVLAFRSILSEVQSVNSVFASVSLPVSVNTQGTFLNQVYVGMFRPSADSMPRWNGNLKQYKLGVVNDALKLLDADDEEAISSSGSGFIAECARSFWTPTTEDDYWTNFSQENCTGFSASSNTPDGNIVEKGAQGYMLRSISSCTTTESGTTCTIGTPRDVKTCSPIFSSCTTVTSFNTGNAAITQALLDPTSTIARETLINWARGLDTQDENLNNQTTTEMRPSAHGDVVHSRPVALNYGTDADPQVVVFYGANDGMLRAVNGNRTNSITSNGNTYAAGRELWSFMPPEFYGSIKRLYQNTPPVSYKDGNIPGAKPKNYGMDGPITAYKDDSRAWLYATMRRGGRAVYAFDVTTPANPVLKWKVGCPNNFPASGTVSDDGCTSGFSGIGQTWSSPKTLKAEGYNSGNSPVLVMGGGYDTCEDADPQSCSSPKGNQVYVLDADSGALLNTLATDRSVTGDVHIVRDEDGFARYVYATDTGGNIYRITLGTAAPADWTITKIASVGCDTVTTCSPNRKFLFGPDVVVDGDINYVLVGSGDREKPLASYTAAYGVSNYFYMVKDKPTDGTWLSSEGANCGTSVICLGSLLFINTNETPTDADLESTKGWYLALSPHEQVVTNAVTLFGVTTFSTHIPAVGEAESCESNLGTANVYNIRYKNAASANGNENRYEEVAGGGLSPSPTAGVVILDDGSTVPFVIGANPTSPLEGGASPGSSLSVTQPKGRVFWYLEQ